MRLHKISTGSLLSLWYRIRFAVFVTLLSMVLIYLRYGTTDFTQYLALKGNDLMQLMAPTVTAKNVVLMEITDADTDRQGQWPWPRKNLGTLVQRLRNAGAGVIVFVDVFSEPDLARTDADFGRAIADNGVVLARSVQAGQVKDPVSDISGSASAVGFADVAVDADGVVRRMDLIALKDDRVYYSLGVESLRALTGDLRPSMHPGTDSVSVGLTGVEPWVINNQNRWRIKYNREIPTLKFSDADLSLVKDRVVIVGVATHAVNNWVRTPVGGRRIQWVQAQYLQSLFDRNNLITPPWADLLEVLISILIITSILKAAKNNTPYACIPVYLSGIVVTTLGSWMLFNAGSMVVDWAWPVLSSTSVFALTFYYHLARKRSAERTVFKQFGGSVSNTVLKTLQKDPSMVKTTGELKELSVLYADLRGFAGLAQSYSGNAEGLVQLVHGYMDQILPTITSNTGTVDKLTGDGFMAFWNAPLEVINHAAQAVKTATEILAQIQNMNQLLTPEESPLCLDIGINTGAAVVGNTGSQRKFNYTCMGDSARTADNLELMCKQYGVNLLLGEQTAAQVRDQYAVVELDTVFAESGSAMRVFTVVIAGELEQIQDQHGRMLENYYASRYDGALKQCRELKNTGVLTEYYTLMLAKVRGLRAAQRDAESADATN